MYNIYQETPMGAQSRGWDQKDEAMAQHYFESVVNQVRTWSRFSVDVVLTDDGIDIKREEIRNAS